MTKLYIPAPGKYLVGRERLVEKLNGCLEPGCRLALISAPAGFGKTTLLAAWVAALKDATTPEPQVAWLSIDEGDNDPVIFWSYVIAALQTRLPGVGQQALGALAAPGGGLEPKLALLINDLAQPPHPAGPLVLALDDYHLIRSPQIHQSLAFLIEHAPPHVHLLIASRTDPPLPLALLRGRGRLLEIRLNDLRFSDDDAGRYLNDGLGLNLAAQSVQALNHKTEGWIAGLQMASIAMQSTLAGHDSALEGGFAQPAAGAGQVDGFVAAFSGSNRFILDYLVEEVLNRQPEPVQQFLIQTSILDRLCAPLCDALLEGSPAAQAGAQATLHYLETGNLFIFPLDQQRYWYRYHQLFADLLRKRLAQAEPELARELHRRAIAWYEQNGLIPSAIRHAFQLRDSRKAAALVAQVTEAMWGRGEHATLLAWMDALPAEEKKPYPSLLTFQVSMLISAGKLKEAEACIPILESYIQEALQANPQQGALVGNAAALRAYIASFHNDWPALYAHAATALQHLTRAEDAGQRCGVSLVLGNGYLTEGLLEEAARAFEEGVAAGKAARKPPMLLTGLSNLAVVLSFQGSLNRAAQVCQEALDLIRQYNLERSPMGVDVYVTWGDILRERGELAEAEPFIRRALEVAQEQQFTWQTARAQQALARLLLAQGSLPEAEAAAQAAITWTEAHHVPEHYTCPARALLAEIWLRQGRLAEAERVLHDHLSEHLHSGEVSHTNESLHMSENPHLTLALGQLRYPHQSEHLAWARMIGQRGDGPAAAALLERFGAWAEEHHMAGMLAASLLLQSLVCHTRGELEQAMPLFARALALAEAQGYAQTITGEGEPAAALLDEAVRRSIRADFAAQLLARFPNLPAQSQPVPAQTTAPAALNAALPRRVPAETPPLAEPLSPRELETLRLMAEGYSNKEIAQQLCLSLRTVKYYSTGLYNKLGVDSRMQAVKRARELGLL